MKKSLLIIGIVIAIIITGITTVQAADTTAQLTASATSVKPGDTFTVTLSAACDGGIALISGSEADDGFALNYDTSKLELVSKEAKRLIDLNEEATSGTICLMGSSTSFTSGDVYVVTFKVKSDAADGNIQVGVTPIKITDFNDVETAVTVQSATVEIKNNGSETPTDPTDPITPDSSNNNSGSSSTTGTCNGGSTISSTAGKTTDTTTATAALPKTGNIAFVGGCFVVLATVLIFTYKKIRLYKEVK